MDPRKAIRHDQFGGVTRVDAGDDRIHEHRGGFRSEATRGEGFDRFADVTAFRAEGFGEQAELARPAEES
jgi:hypothetical protein